MNPTIIEEAGQRFVKLPLAVFEQLSQDAEMLEDITAFDDAKREMNHALQEGMPLTYFRRILAGESTLCVWREYRGMTQQQLADISSVNRSLIGHIEARVKIGSVGTLRKLADALNCTLDDLAE